MQLTKSDYSYSIFNKIIQIFVNRNHNLLISYKDKFSSFVIQKPTQFIHLTLISTKVYKHVFANYN